MKKLLFVMMAIFAISLNATVVDVYMINGKKIEGVLMEQNDSVLIVRPNNMPDGMFIKPELVKYFLISGIGRYDVVDGKFVPTQQAKAAMAQVEQKAREKEKRNRVLAANPNEVIGKAFKNTGAVCIGVGIPSLVVGSILMGIGCSDVKATDNPIDDQNKAKTHANCTTAGCVLMSTGAALTIVGIPLHIHGKRIAELKFNYTGNGAGMSVDF